MNDRNINETTNGTKPLLGEVHLLTDKQLTDAFHILFGKDWKKYWTERDKAAEMRSIFKGGTQPCCPFENWVKMMEFLASHFASSERELLEEYDKYLQLQYFGHFNEESAKSNIDRYLAEKGVKND